MTNHGACDRFQVRWVAFPESKSPADSEAAVGLLVPICGLSRDNPEPSKGSLAQLIRISLAASAYLDDPFGDDLADKTWLAFIMEAEDCLVVSGEKHGSDFAVERTFGRDELEHLSHGAAIQSQFARGARKSSVRNRTQIKVIHCYFKRRPSKQASAPPVLS